MSEPAPIHDTTRVIVGYNSATRLRWQAERSARLPTLLVDNASVDATVPLARSLGYRVLAFVENQGFGRGVMAGLRAVPTEFALVINPDAAMDGTAVQTLVAAARRYPECDLFLPRLVDETGGVFFRHESSLERRTLRRVPEGTACIPMISGAAMLIRVRPFLAFGGFDPAIFLYFEDDDLALRYRAERRPMIYVPEAHALHLGDRSTAGDPEAGRVKDVSFGWSRAYLMAKHRRGLRWPSLAGMVAKLAIYAVAGRRQRMHRQVGRIEGFRAALRGEPAPYLPENTTFYENMQESSG